jgi:hypothetical protein
MDERRAALLKDTIEIWQSHYARALTHEDARQVVENVAGFFTTLLRWSNQAGDSAPAGPANEQEEHHDELSEDGRAHHSQRSGERAGGEKDHQDRGADHLEKDPHRADPCVGSAAVLPDLPVRTAGTRRSAGVPE